MPKTWYDLDTSLDATGNPHPGAVQMYLDANGRAIPAAAATPMPVTAGSGALSTQVQGTAADSAAAVGNPVLGGNLVATTAPTTLVAGDVASARADALGNTLIAQGFLPAGTARGGTITAGGTAQALAAANAARKGLTGQNISSEDMWIDETGGTAAANTAGSYRIASGQPFKIETNQAVSIVAATTGSKWSATEY